MKYAGFHLTGKKEQVHEFVLGKEELRVIRNCLNQAYRHTPESVETLILRRRVANMLHCIEKTKILPQL